MTRVKGHLPSQTITLDPDQLERRGLTLRAVGWLILIFTVMIDSVFIFVGLRDGSLLWLYLTIGQGIVALALIGAGIYEERRAVELMGHVPAGHVEAGETEPRRVA